MELVWGSVGLFLGFLAAYLWGQRKNQSHEMSAQLLQSENEQLNLRIEKKENELVVLRDEKEDLVRAYIHIEAAHQLSQQQLSEHKNEVASLQEHFTVQFENLAQRIFEEKSQKFTVQNKQALQLLLDPLQEKIKTFEHQVTQSHKEALVTHASLKEQLLYLTSLNQKMNEETQNLTKALKAETKTQGNWGEVILERVLEQSGLEKDREYRTQVSFTNDTGQRVQPDVVIYLPEQQHVVIDAKVSLTAYERFVNASTAEEQELALKQHLTSIKNHVSGLSDKGYYSVFEGRSPEFVLLFIPVETAFTAALRKEPQLYQMAFDKKIVIVTATTLMATLQTIHSLWQTKKQQENALEIARQAGLMFDKFVGFVNDIEQVGVQLQRTQNEFDKAKNKLYEGKGNLVSSAQKLKELGVKSKKQLE